MPFTLSPHSSCTLAVLSDVDVQRGANMIKLAGDRQQGGGQLGSRETPTKQ